MKFGVNTWVWVSPLTTKGIAELAPKVKAMGFDWFEVPLELTDNINYTEAASILRDNDLAVSVCAAMGEDRDLIHPDKAIRDNGMAYLKHCIDAVVTLGVERAAGDACVETLVTRLACARIAPCDARAPDASLDAVAEQTVTTIGAFRAFRRRWWWWWRFAAVL